MEEKFGDWCLPYSRVGLQESHSLHREVVTVVVETSQLKISQRLCVTPISKALLGVCCDCLAVFVQISL